MPATDCFELTFRTLWVTTQVLFPVGQSGHYVHNRQGIAAQLRPITWSLSLKLHEAFNMSAPIVHITRDSVAKDFGIQVCQQHFRPVGENYALVLRKGAEHELSPCHRPRHTRHAQAGQRNRDHAIKQSAATDDVMWSYL